MPEADRTPPKAAARQSFNWRRRDMSPWVRIFAVLVFAAIGNVPATAQKFPNKPVELICTTSPGSQSLGLVSAARAGTAEARRARRTRPGHLQERRLTARTGPLCVGQARRRSHPHARERELLRLLPPAALQAHLRRLSHARPGGDACERHCRALRQSHGDQDVAGPRRVRQEESRQARAGEQQDRIEPSSPSGGALQGGRRQRALRPV
jgi:hypothetical protein